MILFFFFFFFFHIYTCPFLCFLGIRRKGKIVIVKEKFGFSFPRLGTEGSEDPSGRHKCNNLVLMYDK